MKAKRIWQFCLTLLVAFSAWSFESKAQNYYFPPLTGNNWDTVSPQSLGWCISEIDSLENYLLQKNSKAYIVLKNGKIVLENYFGTFTKDSLWYWASASKSLTGFLTGVAQEQQFLTINDTVSHYLGSGWTTCPPAKEGLIKIKDQLSMTTGLDDAVPDDFCTIDTCLKYLADAGTRWAYHNAPYHLLQDVIAAASGLTYQSFTQSRIKNRIGMQGFWYDYTYYSRARDMARFGLLSLNRGIWNNDTLLHDSVFFNDMISSSQSLNQAYGYLWWLNGKSSFMLPQSQFVFNGKLIPNAPNDTYAALGKNDQKIYVVPSLDLVVIRMGNASGTPMFALSSFDNEIWDRLNKVMCAANAITSLPTNRKELELYPNPANDQLTVIHSNSNQPAELKILDAQGKCVRLIPEFMNRQKIAISDLKPGLYLIDYDSMRQKFLISR